MEAKSAAKKVADRFASIKEELEGSGQSLEFSQREHDYQWGDTP